MAKSKSSKSTVTLEALIEVLESERTSFTNVWEASGKCFGQGSKGHFSIRYANAEVSILLTGMESEDVNGYVPNDIVNSDDVIAVMENVVKEVSLHGPSKAAIALAPKSAAKADEV